MTNKEETKINESLKYFKEKGITIYTEMPNGWFPISGATTAPPGYVWIQNRKSVFSKEHEQGLLKKE